MRYTTASTAASRPGRSASAGTRYGIPASRILPLARTRRWAMVGSGTRNACAISAVVSPPSSRSVSATRAAVPSAGWQQVNMSRSRSSRTGPSSRGSSWACKSAAWACLSARAASRRSRSIARLRAVVMIHPAGLGGNPASGHRRAASANASWTASSAVSMSPKTRVRTATARPYSSRKTPSMSASAGPGTLSLCLLPGLILERPHLDRDRAREGGLAAPSQRGIQVGGLDHPEAAHVLLALDERSVGDEDVAAVRPDHGRRAGRVQPAGEDPRAGLLKLGVQRVDVGHDLLHDLWLGDAALGVVHAEQVLLHPVPPRR